MPGSEVVETVDTLITAVGQERDLSFLPDAGSSLDPASGETSDPGVLIGGDALRGPSSIIVSLADGRRAAERILSRAGRRPGGSPRPAPAGLDRLEHQKRLAFRKEAVDLSHLPLTRRQSFHRVIPSLAEADALAEAGRCVHCDVTCLLCYLGYN